MSDPLPGPDVIPVLLVEDNPVDAGLVRGILEGGEIPGFQVRLVESLHQALTELQAQPPRVVILDLTLPDAQGLLALREIRALRDDLPVVILSATSDEAVAIQAVSEGAQDYLVKGGIAPDLLGRSLRYAIERQRLVVELREALARVRTLSGLLPICASCKNIRDDGGYWQAVDVYVQTHTDAAFSHALCPDCAVRLYPDLMDDNWRERGGESGEVSA